MAAVHLSVNQIAAVASMRRTASKLTKSHAADCYCVLCRAKEVVLGIVPTVPDVKLKREHHISDERNESC